MKRRIFSILSIFMLLLFVSLIAHFIFIYKKNPGISFSEIFERYLWEYIAGLSALILFIIWGNSIK